MFEEFYKNPWFKEVYDNASDLLKRYYYLSWEYNSKDFHDEVKDEVDQLKPKFTANDWIYLIAHTGIVQGKIAYDKLFEKYHPAEHEIYTVKRRIEQLGADTCKIGEEWNGYKVYEPIYKTPVYTGMPLVFLAKDGKVRVSTEDEALDYLAYTLRNEPDEE